MDHDIVAELRTTLRADHLTLVQPVVRGDVLLLGRRLDARAEGIRTSPDVGHPFMALSGEAARDRVLERFHLDGGGVLGIAPPGVHYETETGLQPLDMPHLLFDQVPGVAVWLVLDGATLGAVHAHGPGISADTCRDAEAALIHLRRCLARRFEALTSTLTRVGVPPGSTGPEALRPVRAPIAPLGLLLTPTERAIARYLPTSATLAEIAENRGCSPATVQRHRDNIYAALGVSRRVEIAERLREL